MCEDCEWEEALELVEQIEAEADDVPERGEDFAASVVEKSKDIGTTIEVNEHVSDAQRTALDNMLAGLQRWTRR